jgi:PAS domain S-box-containing protein
MDQYDYLTREQLVSLIRAPADGDELPQFGERARRAFERCPSPMRIFDLETLRYLAVNDAALRYYGYTREEFLALSLKDTRHPDEHAEQNESMTEAAGYLRHGKLRRQVRKSGDIGLAEVVVQDILFEERRARLTLTIDLTPRMRMQELLWQRQQEFESLAENLPDLVARYDRDGRFLYVNSAIERALGVERGKLIGCTQREVGLPAELVALYDESTAGVFATGEPHKIEFRLAAAGGERRYEAHHVAEYGAAGKIGSVLCVARDITGHKQAEFEAQRSAEMARLLESLARAANEAVTPEAAMAACLERICAHGGWVIGRVMFYGEGESAGAPSQSIWHTADRRRFAELIEFSNDHAPAPGGAFLSRVLREQSAVWIEDIGRNPGFTRKAIMVRCRLRSAFAFPVIVRGAVVAFMEVFGDESRPQDPLTIGAAQSLASQLARIVERERAQEVNAKLAAIVESSQDAIISRALDGTILTWNTGAERLLGYTAAEIVGRNLEVLYPPELKPKQFGRQGLVLQGKATPTFETERIAKDGRRVQVSLSSAPIRDASGEARGISTIMRDITGRKLAEQELWQTQQHLQMAVHGGNVGLWDWDVRAGTVYFSPEWKRQLGYEAHELPNRFEEWEGRVHPEDLPRVKAEVERILAQPQDYQQEYRLRHRDGSYRWILSKASSQLGESGNVERMFGCHVDITAQKQAEAERLEHAARQRDALVREVHHRIKNNLQGVIGLLRQKFRKYPAAGPEIEEAITQLQTVAAVYGLQGGRADGMLSLAEMVEAICASAESLTGGHVDRAFERRSARPVCVAGADAVSVAVALNELLFNALKHQSARAGSKRASVLLREAEGVAEIRIGNRGRLPREFDYAAGRALGNGLGLVRMLLASPGGDVEFSNGRDRVEVRLKLAPPLLAGRQQWLTRRRVDGATGTKKGAAARAGRGRRPAGAGRAG